ncbi:MAG TPA: Holliday junction branch migration protein RuvA [Vicinamibacterales bacterium]|jgi:Holliday junction DNA helicase RuvA
MIAWLRGRLVEKQPNRLVLDVHGVGYDVAVPLSTFYALGEPGAETVLRIHTHVREDALALFGFATARELDLFARLIGISGVGPKLGLAVLSGIDPPELVRAIQQGDIKRLTAIPGVGRKTAERIALELKDRLPESADDAIRDTPAGRLREDLLSALLNLGYHRPHAERAIDAALPDGGEPSFEDALRQVLRALAP